jgi:hypothetical protein
VLQQKRYGHWCSLALQAPLQRPAVAAASACAAVGLLQQQVQQQQTDREQRPAPPAGAALYLWVARRSNEQSISSNCCLLHVLLLRAEYLLLVLRHHRQPKQHALLLLLVTASHCKLMQVHNGRPPAHADAHQDEQMFHTHLQLPDGQGGHDAAVVPVSRDCTHLATVGPALLTHGTAETRDGQLAR